LANPESKRSQASKRRQSEPSEESLSALDRAIGGLHRRRTGNLEPKKDPRVCSCKPWTAQVSPILRKVESTWKFEFPEPLSAWDDSWRQEEQQFLGCHVDVGAFEKIADDRQAAHQRNLVDGDVLLGNDYAADDHCSAIGD